MKNKNKKLTAAVMAGVMCFSIFSACSTGKVPASPDPSASLEAPGVSQGTTEVTPPSTSTYDFPAMGMTITLPETLLTRMEQGQVTMLENEVGTADGSALQYGLLSWNTLTGEMPEQQAEDAREMSLACYGVLGVYQAGMVDQLDALTGCDEHQQLGQSADGAYQYYLSTSTKADAELTAELRQIQVAVTAMEAFQSSSGTDVPSSDLTGTSLGEFTTQDINGQTYTQDVFKDYDLTMVNVFATWCSPCVQEMPDLEKLHQQMADRGVNVVGIVLDVLNEKGEIVQEELERAQLLVERTGVTYPILLPDATYMNGRLTGIEALPETFFVDRNGNIVGETYSGSGGLEDWLSVVEQELANLQEGA